MTHSDRKGWAHATGGPGSAEPAAANEEVEWQLDAPELGAVERWLDALPGGRAAGSTEVGAPRPALIEDIYLDTDDRRLRRAGYALRVRGRRSIAPPVAFTSGSPWTICRRASGPSIPLGSASIARRA